MTDAAYDRDEQATVFRVPVDDATTAWLIELAELCHVEVRFVIAAILRDIRIDDETAHLCEPKRSGGGLSLN